jgi:hypothetical protein
MIYLKIVYSDANRNPNRIRKTIYQEDLESNLATIFEDKSVQFVEVQSSGRYLGLSFKPILQTSVIVPRSVWVKQFG